MRALLFTLFTHIVFIGVPGLATSSVIRIGVLVEAENDAMEDVVALAINQINEDEELLSHSVFEHVIQKVPTGETFAVIKSACILLSAGVSGVVSALSCDANRAIASMMEDNHLFHISVLRHRCEDDPASFSPSQDGYSFSIRPNITLSNAAMVDLTRVLKWNKTVIFYENSEDQAQVQNMLRGEFGRTVMIRYKDESHVKQQLAQVKERDFKHFAVYCTLEGTINILRQASSFGMTIGEYEWVIVSQVMSDVELHRFNNIAGIVTVLRQSVYTETDNPQFAEAWARVRLGNKDSTGNPALSPVEYDQVVRAYLYDAIQTMATVIDDVIVRGKWQSPGNLTCNGLNGNHRQNLQKGSQRFKKTLRKIRLEGLLGEISFSHGSYNDHLKMDLISVENLMNSSHYWRIGSWDNNRGLELIQKPFTRNFDLYKTNQTLRIVTIVEAPFVMREDTPRGPKYSGYCIDLIHKIADTLKVKYDLYEVPDSKYGSQNDDGTWNGLVGEVYYGRAHLAVAGMITTSERQRVVDFTKPFMNYDVSILIRKPQQATNTFAFLQPLRISVWGCVLASILLIGVVMFLLDRLSPFSDYNVHRSSKEGRSKFNLMNSLWFTFSGFMQQGADYTPVAVSSRIMGAFWWFGSLIVVATYTANLAAFLTVSRMDTSINSLEDLAQQSKIEYGTVEDSSLMRWFQRRAEQDELYSRLWSLMSTVKPSAWVHSPEQGYDRVLNENYAFFWDSPILDYTKQTRCELMTVGKPFNLKGYGVATPRGAPYREEISVLFLKMQEQGLLEGLRKKWFEKESLCSSLETSRGQPRDVQLEMVAGVFYVLAMGAALAFITLFLEIIWSFYRKYKTDVDSTDSKDYELAKTNSL
ncbi:glutamate receptor ionotropic, kainate 2-like isoform X2 [Ptychodera flava]|uniref:glutamate receptor ionotropic, kainate 2-like isoform X2 n=1 Tax=Ptychodera flava TaxID=63121 RepID=UPI00396A934B